MLLHTELALGFHMQMKFLELLLFFNSIKGILSDFI